jgi:hypothetical protein
MKDIFASFGGGALSGCAFAVGKTRLVKKLGRVPVNASEERRA